MTDPQPNMGNEILYRPHGQSDPIAVLAKDLDIDLKAISVIYKMHGTVDRAQQQRAQYVITEDDYEVEVYDMDINQFVRSLQMLD